MTDHTAFIQEHQDDKSSRQEILVSATSWNIKFVDPGKGDQIAWDLRKPTTNQKLTKGRVLRNMPSLARLNNSYVRNA
jgi:hypothetical protein